MHGYPTAPQEALTHMAVDLAKLASLADRSALTPYLGRDVLRTTIKITKTGDGLSQSMAIQPQVFSPGEKVLVLLECTAGEHAHKPNKDAPDYFDLKQTLEAGMAVIVDEELVDEVLVAQRLKLEKAIAQVTGQEKLEGMDPLDPGSAAALERPDPEWGEGSPAGDGADAEEPEPDPLLPDGVEP